MKTPLGTTFFICLSYWLKIPITTISTILGVGKKTVGFRGSVIRVCCSKLWNSTQRVVGGEGKIVEMDEAIWRKRKYGRGRKKEQIWIFGWVERLEGGGTGSSFMTIVLKRKKNYIDPNNPKIHSSENNDHFRRMENVFMFGIDWMRTSDRLSKERIRDQRDSCLHIHD
ncbi:uncharacterized protein MONOS_4310 [Monocercomonoides exilis]|uniref:uncharacterized protein n=1 Tax=Monocercomonoides exilis TaxID=2049356 RepID=UPI0035597D6A|nr:hypothetical protein MONOS_4310 [Monocercomonoides exilis]|eukprot:MONOS_4310.1-p1 / transcript=MONOS_4310.1 / gene=MONOS_4310 / organism=Monocercomonoides_exilis_PA203 / gene_product=unspecified product / transcript_product=unspecified product / location=Mono_scaffold00113:34538-35044(+) / protein_length=169 / sequence_SO=supercontig / SO=protein_coding / is_pseudo=false